MRSRDQEHAGTLFQFVITSVACTIYKFSRVRTCWKKKIENDAPLPVFTMQKSDRVFRCSYDSWHSSWRWRPHWNVRTVIMSVYYKQDGHDLNFNTKMEFFQCDLIVRQVREWLIWWIKVLAKPCREVCMLGLSNASAPCTELLSTGAQEELLFLLKDNKRVQLYIVLPIDVLNRV